MRTLYLTLREVLHLHALLIARKDLPSITSWLERNMQPA